MRRPTRPGLLPLALCGALAASAAPAAAQEPGRASVGQAGEQRPAVAPLQVPAASPELDALLQTWHLQTAKIQKLEGTHQRWIYDTTFNVEMRATGYFYYVSPDKGRIDIEPTDPAGDSVSPAEGFTLKADRPQKWVCDGTKILQINDADRTYEAVPIPPQHQGANIMDGPLPFLFGMPPDKAKQRYDMRILKQEGGFVFLKVLPRTRQDSANWQEADVILSQQTFLPSAVRMLDPSGNKRTVYKFPSIEVNKNGIINKIFARDPFRPNLVGYKPVQAEPVEVVGAKGIPSVVGLKFDAAKATLGALGYKVRPVRGQVASNPALLYVVEKQSPPAGTAVEPGGEIALTLYDDPKRTAQGGN